MKICQVVIDNFRNFKHLDVSLNDNAVIIGANKIGKSNFIQALRLVLDPTFPDHLRTLREEDFWDGLPRPLSSDDYISVQICLSDFSDNAEHVSILSDYLISGSPMVAKLTYLWRTNPLYDGESPSITDFEFINYGGDSLENRVGYEIRKRLPVDLIPALRDCEGDLDRWSKSPLRPLLEKASNEVESKDLTQIAKQLDTATNKVSVLPAVKATQDSISKKMLAMVGEAQTIETALRFSQADPDRLIRSLKLYIDEGRRGINEASLGTANLIYFALKALEYDQLVKDGARDHTFQVIEEPEAHLHPNLQRLIFSEYLVQKTPSAGGKPTNKSSTLITTHSPHIVSVANPRDIILLRCCKDANSTVGVSAATIELDPQDEDDIARYLDVNRGESLFAKGIIFVEGDAEKYLLPILAQNNGYDFDRLGISICSVSGTNFAPYLKYFGPKGLNIPFCLFTDLDPREPKDGKPRSPLGHDRIANQIMQHIVSEKEFDDADFEGLYKKSHKYGIFTNTHTFEIDLFKSGLHMEFLEATKALTTNASAIARMQEWTDTPSSLNPSKFLSDIEIIGKGRFAQRLGSIIKKKAETKCPKYITDGLKYVKAII